MTKIQDGVVIAVLYLFSKPRVITEVSGMALVIVDVSRCFFTCDGLLSVGVDLVRLEGLLPLSIS